MRAQPAHPEIPLPPYTPAPNLGDPGEHDATVPAEKFDFTELVDRYDPIVRDSGGRIELPAPRDSILEMMPPRFDFRALAKQSVRYLPLFGAVALLLVFVGGYLAFDDSGNREKSTTTSEPANKLVVELKPDAKADSPKTANKAAPDKVEPDNAAPDKAEAEDRHEDRGEVRREDRRARSQAAIRADRGRRAEAGPRQALHRRRCIGADLPQRSLGESHRTGPAHASAGQPQGHAVEPEDRQDDLPVRHDCCRRDDRSPLTDSRSGRA
jgi:hypothetical protein